MEDIQLITNYKYKETHDEEGVLFQNDPLALNIEDSELVKIVDRNAQNFKQYYKTTYNLFERRRKNELYYFGRQLIELEKTGKTKDYEHKNVDNILFEIMSDIKPLAMSQLPDLIVTPGNQSQESQDSAKLLTKTTNADIKNRNNRQVLSLAFKHRPIYFAGCIMCVWNPELAGGLGDYEFVCVHPDQIEFDYTCTSSNVEKMKWFNHILSLSVEDILMRFPKAKEKFLVQLEKDGIVVGGKLTWKNKATMLDIRQTWFTHYEKADDDKFRKVEGLIWKYKDVILKKMKNPYFDYEGETQIFTYDDPKLESSKHQLGLEEMQGFMAEGRIPDNTTVEQVYHNYFQNPQKPYFLMTYDQWGKQPLDETSDFEQNINNQASLDEINKIVHEQLKNRGHHVWSKESGLKPADIEKMDHNNPDEDYLVDGKVSNVHAFVPPEMVSQQEFAETDRLQNRMFAMGGANAVRGQVLSQTATTNQIARESNYTRADDIVDDTINAASEWMARWALHMIKVFYTKEHFREIFGDKGEMLYMKLHQDLVKDGMQVMIKASGTDKIKAQNNAMDMAKMQLTDPLSFFTDMGLDDPESRTVKLVTWMKDPMTYLQQFVETSGETTQDLIAKLNALPVPQPQAPQQQMGQAPQTNPQNPSPQDTTQVPTQPPAVVQGSSSML